MDTWPLEAGFGTTIWYVSIVGANETFVLAGKARDAGVFLHGTGLQCEGSEVFFRRVELLPLTETTESIDRQ